jgi:hypothetical protein
MSNAAKDRIASLLGSVRKTKSTKETQVELPIGPFIARVYAGRTQKRELTGALACKCSLPSWHFSSSIYLGELVSMLDELGILTQQPKLIDELEIVAATITDPGTVAKIVNATIESDSAKGKPAAAAATTESTTTTATPSTADRLAALKSAAAIG